MEDKWRSSRPKILHEKHLKVIPLINNSAKKWNRAWEVHFSGASSEKISRSQFKGGEFVIKGQTTQEMNWKSSATGPMNWWIHKFEIRGTNYCQYTWWMSQEMTSAQYCTYTNTNYNLPSKDSQFCADRDKYQTNCSHNGHNPHLTIFLAKLS